MKNKRIVYFLFWGILLSGMLAGCKSKSTNEKSGGTVIQTASEWALQVQELACIQESEEKAASDVINGEIWQKYNAMAKEFGPDDFAPEEIACENVLAEYQDGRQNAELLSLYGVEIPMYLYYAKYDYNSDGLQDYVVICGSPESAEWQQGDVCGGDIWIAKEEDGGYRRQTLPEDCYMVGGSWEKPEFSLMVLNHWFDGAKAIAVYRDFPGLELVIYGYCFEHGYERVGALKRKGEAGDAVYIETIYQNGCGYYMAPVRLEIIKEQEGDFVYQVFLTERLRHTLFTEADENITVWDGNDDGFEDILYYAGYDGGSGGTFLFYELFIWSEQENCYMQRELPGLTNIDYEAHKLYNKGQIGCPHQFYEIYGLQDGEYRLEKELELIYEVWQDEKVVDIARYSEWGEVKEETDITGLDWEETKALMEEKYPEFNFWREG